MEDKRGMYFTALQTKKRGSLLRDAIILLIIAIILFCIGLGTLRYFSPKTKAAHGGTIVTPLQTGVAANEQGKLIPINEAQLPGGQYLSQQYVPILTYHYIRELPGDDDKLGQNLSVSPENFAKQMEYLASAGYESITFDDLRSGNIPDKPIILTFDDGYNDAYTDAFPVLQANGLTGIFYLITGFMDNDRYLTWSQAREMSLAGMVFGSHTVDHPDLTSDKITAAEIKQELTISKRTIENQLGVTVNDFCYPSGQANTATVSAVNDAGYKTATSTQISIVQSGNYWLWLPRLRIKNDTNLQYLLNLYL